MRYLLILFVLFVTTLAPATAQDDTCNWSEAEANLAAILTNLDRDPGLTMVILQATLNDLRIRCASTVYDAGAFPDGIIGPIFLTSPIYEITLTTGADPVSMSAYTIENNCTVSDLTAQPGTSNTTLWQVSRQPCTVMIEVNGTGWSLSITPLA